MPKLTNEMVVPVANYIAQFAPHQWKEALHRGGAIAAYLQGKTSLAAHDIVAANLGIKRRKLYFLIAAFQRAQERDNLTFRHGERAPVDPEVTALIDAAVEKHGSGASPSLIYDALLESCSAAGLSNPSRTTVVTRLSRTPAVPDVATKIGASAEFVIDYAQLDLFVPSPSGDPLPTYLAALIEVATGAVLHHRLTTEPASGAAVAQLIAEFSPAPTDDDRMLHLESSFPVQHDDRELTSVLQHRGITIAKTFMSGTALTATFGKRIGRVRICHYREPAQFDGIDLGISQRVITALVQRRNRLLPKPLSTGSHADSYTDLAITAG